MMLMFKIDGLPHCPRNRSHTILRKGKASFLGKTEMAREYERAIKQELRSYRSEAELFAKEFDPKTMCLMAVWHFYSPDVLTKDGRISRNSTDLDAHKVLQDTVMEFIGIDDAYITTDTRNKHQGDYSVLFYLYTQPIEHEKTDDGSDLL